MARIIGDEPGYIRPAVYPGSPKKTIVPVPVYHPPKPVAPPPGTGGGGGGGGKPAGPPDYMALLKGSPAYQAWLQNANFRKTGLTNQRAAAIRQLILQFGGLPKGFKDAFGDLRPEDMAAAEANQFGAEQSIERAYQGSGAGRVRPLPFPLPFPLAIYGCLPVTFWRGLFGASTLRRAGRRGRTGALARGTAVRRGTVAPPPPPPGAAPPPPAPGLYGYISRICGRS